MPCSTCLSAAACSPHEISELLGTDPESVVGAREAALEQVATELDMDDGSGLDEVRARLAELPAEAWTGDARPKLSVVSEEGRRSSAAIRERRRSRLPLLLALLAIAAVALVVVLATSGGSDTSSSPKPQASAPKPVPQQPSKPSKKPSKPKPAPATSQKAQLEALGSSGASGTATLTSGTAARDQGERAAERHVSGVALQLGDRRREPHEGERHEFSLDLKLPSDASHYRYVDISLEPNDGNPNHSGESVLRVALSKLSR